MAEGRILAVDPGSKHLGIALSDPFRMLATPLAVIGHVSMEEDCRKILLYCDQNEVTLVLVGQAMSTNGEVNPQTRHAQKLAGKLSDATNTPVLLWDESGSTKIAKKESIEMGMNRKARAGHMDDRAAAVILQSYLDSMSAENAHE